MKTSRHARPHVKLSLARSALLSAGLILAACDQTGSAPPDVESPQAVAEAEAAPAPVLAPLPTTSPAEALPAAAAAAPGAPTFAVLYPGAAADSPALSADGPDGPGGLVTYTTQADPDAVIAFYRQKAEAAGLSSVMAMNQGLARAYGAAATDVGASLQVVASPTDDGETSVQLSWSAGQ